MSESTLSRSNNAAGIEGEPRQEFSRRDFLRFAGIGAASLALSGSLPNVFVQPAYANELTDATIAEAAAADRVIGWLHWDDGGDTPTPFIFEQSFFDGGAMTYNAHLSTFGCCLALSAINAEAGGGSGHKYVNMYRNVRNFMNQIGIEDGDEKAYIYQCDGVAITGHKAGNIAWNSDFEKAPTYDANSTPKASIGLCIGHRKIKAAGQDYNLVLLGIRGGNYELEWCSNFTAGTSGNHEGFQEAAEAAERFLKCHIDGFGLTGPTKILINGYSRGGAVTNLTAGNIVKYAIDHGAAKISDEEGYDVSSFFGGSIKVRQCDLYGYGYEVPAGLLAESNDDLTSAKRDYGNIHNIINPCDPIPKVMPADWNFTRYGIDRVMPGPADRARYTRGRERMLDRMSALGLHRKSQFGYSLDGFPAMDYDFLKGTGARFETLYDMKTLDIYLEDFIPWVAKEVFHERVRGTNGSLPGYVDRYQAALIAIMELYTAFDLDNELNAKGSDGKSPLENFMSAASGGITCHTQHLYEQMIAGAPLTDIIGYVTSSMKQVKITDTETVDDRYGERIRFILKSLLGGDHLIGGLPIPEGVDKVIDIDDLPGIQSSLSNFINAHTKEVFAFGMKAGLIMSAHNNDLCLAWLQSRDSYYTKYGKEDIPDAPALDSEKTSTVAAAAALAAAGDDVSWEEADPSTYRKIFFNGGTDISYVVNGTSYQIFKDGQAVYADDEGTPITVEGQECPFVYGLDSDLQQAIYPPDSANLIDGGTDYVFHVTTKPGAPLKCTAARCSASDGFPESLYIYESNPESRTEPLVSFTFTVKMNELDGNATSASGESGEGFMCEFDTVGVTSTINSETTVEEDTSSTTVDRYYTIETRSADPDAGGTVGGGVSLRGTVSIIEAVPLDGYEFDYWTIDDKWMVDGQEESPKYWIDFTVDDDGNLVRKLPDNIPAGEWVEGERAEGEILGDAHVYRIVVDGDHLVTAHFKVATPAPEPAADPNANGGDNTTPGNTNQNTAPASTAKATAKTGDASVVAGVAAAAVAAAAGATALKAAKEAE